jgi:hypothetical protein
VVRTSTGGGLGVVAQATGGLNAVDALHAQVHDDDVDVMLGDGGGDLVAVGALHHDLEAVTATEDAAQT